MSDIWGAATSSRCSAARDRSWARGENFLSNHTEDQIPTFILSLSDTLGSPRDDRGRNRRYQPLSQ